MVDSFTTRPIRSKRVPIGVCGKVIKWKKVKLSVKEIKKLKQYCGLNIFNVLYSDKCFVNIPLVHWETQFFTEEGNLVIEDVECQRYEKVRKI